MIGIGPILCAGQFLCGSVSIKTINPEINGLHRHEALFLLIATQWEQHCCNEKPTIENDAKYKRER
jgi:hypothetical protein